MVTTLDSGLSGRTVQINTGTAGDTVNLSNGTNFAAATTLNVSTSGGDDAVNVSVNGANINLTVNTGAGAADAVNVGFTAPGQSFGQGNLEGIFGTVNVTDAGDGLTLQVDDFNDNDVDGAVTFTFNSITDAADAGGSIGYTNVTTLNYNLPNVVGTPGDQVNVQSTAAGTTANLFGNAGDDIFTVGSASTVTGILGPVTLNGNAGADAVNYSSQNDPSGTYVVTATTVQRTAPVANAAVTYGTIETLNVNTSNAAGAGDLVNVTGTAAGVATTVNANDGTDTVTVTFTNATGPLTINGGRALDTIVVGSVDTTPTGLGTGNLTNVAGAVVVNGDAGGADLIVDGSAAPVLANYQITSTTVTRSTPAGFGGVTYGTLTTLRLKTGTGPNIIDVPSTVVPTAILTSAGADTIDVGGTTAQTLANIAGPVTIDGGAGAGSTTDNDTVNVNDQNSVGSFTYTIGTAAIMRGATTVVADYNVGGRTENLVVNGRTAGTNTYNVTGTSATVSNTVNDGTAAASGNGTFNIQANAVQSGAANTFNGFLGTDTFNVNFAAGTSVPGAAGTTFVVNGGAPVSLTASRDVLNINTTAVGDGPRTVGITYAATPGDVDVTGLGAAAFLDINGVETVVYTGDAANNDALTVTGTAGNDNITVAPQSLSSALVFLGGNPFDGPPEVSSQLIGLAGGAAGPDMHLRGLATATGLTINGGAGTANHLYVYGRSETSLTDPATAPLDPFGFGAGVLIPGAGVGNAYDNMVVSDAAVRFTAAPNPMAADVRVVTNIVTASFLQTAPTATGLTVNSGDEAAPGAGGVADSIFATLSFNFRIQVNGGDPLPAGAPNGDELQVFAPAEINIWSDQMNPPTVTFNSAGSQQLGFTSIERLTLTPGNGVVNVLGDNNGVAPQADTFIVQGDGPNRFDLSINGSAPIQFLATTALNVLGGALDDTTAVTPFATAIQPWDIVVTVDGQATGANGDRLIYTNVAGLFDDTHVQATGLGAGRINAHGIGAHTTDQVIRFLGTEQVTVLANAGDADALTLDLTTADDAVTFVFDPATAPVTPSITGGTGLPGQPVAAVGNDILLTNLFNLVVDANNAGLVVNGGDGADTFLVNLNLAAAGVLPLALTINAGTGTDAITLQGNAGADTFNNLAGINPQDGVTSLGGTDTAAVSYSGVEALAYNGGGGGADVVNLTGTPGNDTVTVTEDEITASGTATISGQPGITFTAIGTAGANPLRVATFGGDDEITFNQAVVWGITQVSVDAGPPTGSDTFQVNGTASPDDFTFNPTTWVVVVAPNGVNPVTYTPTNVERFVLDGATPAAVPGIVVSDVDATVPAATDFDVTVTLALTLPAIGTLSASPANGVTVGGNGTANVSISGPRTRVNATLGTLVYTPNANRNGTDTITVTVDDQGNIGGGNLTATDTIVVTVTAVNDAPVANPDFATTAEDTPVTIDVRANDTDIETAPGALTVAIATIPPAAQGTVAVVGNQILFTPALNFNGTATFTYTVTDTGDGASPALTSAPALVTVTVTAVNDFPVNGVPGAQTTAEDTALVFTGANALTVSDPADGNQGDMTATVTVTNGRFTLSTVAGLAVTGNGTATVELTGTVAAVNAALAGSSYTPAANFNGGALLTLTTSDNGNVGAGPLVGLTDSDTVAITVTAVNDVPTVTGTAATTAEDTAVNIDLKPFVTDVETPAGAMTYNLGGATNGAVVYVGNGVVRFTPAANYSGPASFTYSVTDGGDGAAAPATSNTATVAVTVTPVADAPTLAVTSPVAGNEGAAIALTVAAALTDPSETLTVSITGFPAGTVFSAGVNDGVTLELTPGQLAGLTARFPDNGTFNLQVIATSTEIDGSTATTPAAPAVNLVVTVNTVNPTATLGNGGPVNEGSTGTVSFTNQADQAQADVVAGFRYSYDFDNDGTFEIGSGTYAGSVTTATATVPAAFLADGPATRTVGARIIDKDGGFTNYTTNITVNNVNPTATFGVIGRLVSGQPATVFFSNQADPSAADVAAGFRYQYDLGTGVFGPPTTSPTATFTPPAPGAYTLRGRIIDKDGGTTEYSATAGVGANAGQVVVANVDTYAVGAGPGGGPIVNVYRAFDNSLVATILAYEPGFRGGVNATMADVTGDGIPDLVTGTGPGGGPVVKVFDGATFALVTSFFAYEPSFRGGVTVAAGDVTGTGTGSIVTGTGFGGGPVLRIFDGVTGQQQVSTVAFGPDAYGRSLREGFTVNASHIGGATGEPRIVVGSGPNYGPTVRVMNAATLAQVTEFIPYEDGFDGGVYVG